MRIVTWNVNSVRIRLHLLKKLVDEARPDIVCLQETKVEDGSFPLEDIRALGFPYVYFTGEKSYNGVAILSKIELNQVEMRKVAGSEHKRHISAMLPGGVALHNFYVPAGGDIPDPLTNPSFDFKLRFTGWMRDFFAQEKEKHARSILLGDLNIAPLENDVWSHKQLLKIVSHTPVETGLLEEARCSLDWVDCARHFVPPEQKLYSWWSYRNQDWKKSDRGRRLDHIWVTPKLKPALKSFQILRHARDWESPSDHVPVICDVDV